MRLAPAATLSAPAALEPLEAGQCASLPPGASEVAKARCSSVFRDSGRLQSGGAKTVLVHAEGWGIWARILSHRSDPHVGPNSHLCTQSQGYEGTKVAPVKPGYVTSIVGNLHECQLLVFAPPRPSIELYHNLDSVPAHSPIIIALAPMLDRLPPELAIRVLERAALDFRFSATDRQFVVHLTSASQAVYAIVAPTLYRTLIVPRDNDERIRSFTFSEDSQVGAAAARMCSHVRILHYPGVTLRTNTALLTPVERVYAMREVIEQLFEQVGTASQPCSLRHITFISAFFTQEVLKLSAHIRAHVTHACGFLPPFLDHRFDRMQKRPAEWTLAILDALPEVTHLGLILVNVRPPEQTTPIITLFDMEALRVVVQTALEYKDGRIRRVALHVAGRYIEQRHRGLGATDQRLAIQCVVGRTTDLFVGSVELS